MANLQTFDLSTGGFVAPTGDFTATTSAPSTALSTTPTVVNAPATAPVNQPPGDAKTKAASSTDTKAATPSKNTASKFPDSNHFKNYIRVMVGTLEFNSNAGQILQKKGTPVICISSYMHSYAEIVINDPDDKYRPEIEKKIAEDCNIEIGFLGAESENKLVGKLYEVGRVPPDGTWIMVIDLSYELNNNTAPSVQFAGNAQAGTASGTDTAVISTEEGNISFYGGTDGFDGKKTASGELFDSNKLTAAHKKLDFGTQVRVTNLSNSKQVTVTVNDRGPYSGDRIMDLSKAAAIAVDMVAAGSTKAKLEILGKVKSTNPTKPTETAKAGATPAANGTTPATPAPLGNNGKPATEPPTPANQPVTDTQGLTAGDLSVLSGAAASADKGSTPPAELFTAGSPSLHFAKDTAFATGKAGTVRMQQTMMAFAQQEALLKGEVIVARGNTLHQVSATGKESSGVTLDYVANRACFRRDPKIIKRTNIQLQSGFGALSVTGYNIDAKQSVGATVVTPGSVAANPTLLVNVPEWGSVKMGDKIPGSRFTWGDATKEGTRVPTSKQIMQSIVAIAAELTKIEAKQGVKLTITSWFRDPATNVRVASSGPNGPHTTGSAVDFYPESDAVFQKIFKEYDASWPGGVAQKRGEFIHLDLVGAGSNALGGLGGDPRRRWEYH